MSCVFLQKPPSRIGFFGLGKSNRDILSRLPESTEVILRSDSSIREIPRTAARIVGIYEGGRAFCDPSEKTLILSPSVRRDRGELLDFKKMGIRLTSDCQLFFDEVRAPVFAVSGSDGKSTTAALTALLLKDRFKKCPLIGNSGVPMLGSLSEENDAYVTELSSFMLSYGRYGVFRGAVTNVTENHLDFHKDFEEYRAAKLSLLQRAKEAVASADDPILAKYLEKSSVYGIFSSEVKYGELRKIYRAQVFYTLEDGHICRSGERLFPAADVRRKESYNIKNLLCALALTDGYVTRERMMRVAKDFSGLEHRAELFYGKDGIDFIDSSIDSTPLRTVQTLNALDRKAVIILGGRGKGLSYEPLKESLEKYAKAVLLCGENVSEIKEVVPRTVNAVLCEDLYSAVKASQEFLSAGDALLLSPASTSYDAFKNFEERGIFFKKAVKEIFNRN